MISVISYSPRADFRSEARYIYDVVVVEVQPRHGVLRFGDGGFLLEGQRCAVRAELDDTVGGRVGHPVRENRSTADILEPAQVRSQSRAVENVVAQHKCHRICPDVLGADHERLGQAFGLGLGGIAQVHPEGRAVTQQALERRRIDRVVITRMSRMPAMIRVDSG